jgi:hypothetical protein
MRVDYRIRVSGRLDEAQDAELRARVGDLVNIATAAGLDVKADPFFFAVPVVVTAVEASPEVQPVEAEAVADPSPDEGDAEC